MCRCDRNRAPALRNASSGRRRCCRGLAHPRWPGGALPTRGAAARHRSRASSGSPPCAALPRGSRPAPPISPHHRSPPATAPGPCRRTTRRHRRAAAPATARGRGRPPEDGGGPWNGRAIVGRASSPGGELRWQRTRNAERGPRNSRSELGARVACSAFRLPRSAFPSWLPRSFRDGRHECLQPLGGEFQRLPLLGAHVCGHQELHDLEAVVERQLRRFAPEEHAHEVPVLGLVAVHRRLARDDGHEPHLRVLLFDQGFTGLTFHLATEEQPERALKRVPRHRVLGAEQLGPEYSMSWNSLESPLRLFFSREVKCQTGEDLVEKQNAEMGLMPVISGEAAVYGYEAEDRHFVRVFLGREAPQLTFDDGLEVVKLLMTA